MDHFVRGSASVLPLTFVSKREAVMHYLKKVPKQPQGDLTLEVVLNQIETAAVGSEVLVSHEIKDKEIILIYDGKGRATSRERV